MPKNAKEAFEKCSAAVRDSDYSGVTKALEEISKAYPQKHIQFDVRRMEAHLESARRFKRHEKIEEQWRHAEDCFYRVKLGAEDQDRIDEAKTV
jgi:hypothetical protein